jgi:hypothetical protein
MHVEGVAEDGAPAGGETREAWLTRFECRGCGFRVGVVATEQEVRPLIDRRMWSDDARHRLERMPPYLQGLVREEVDGFARERDIRVVTLTAFHQARQGGVVVWDPGAEQRLERVPKAVRAMARVELERTALERGEGRVTIALMEDLKARYFGMFAKDSG